MIKRFIFALEKGWKHRQEINKFLTQEHLILNDLDHLNLEMLDALHVAVVILDFDGVLAPHNAKQPTKAAGEWLRKFSMVVGEQRIAILSNKPKPQRKKYFDKHFPGIQWVEGMAKKPYPDGIIHIAQSRGISPSRVLIVDDRLLTGILASCEAPCQAKYFARPITRYWTSPLKELFFSILRVSERFFFKIFK